MGSVRRAFSTTTSAPAYSYDPYGSPLQVTAPVTDFGYAGMPNTADIGLYLTNYRAYDPAVGRWLSRDLISDSLAGLYIYGYGNPITNTDPLGLVPMCGPHQTATPYLQTITDRVFSMKTSNMNIDVYDLGGGARYLYKCHKGIPYFRHILDTAPLIVNGSLLNENRPK
ncbi:RHS repeat-associated core domain-containing protein [Mesorhizobium sp.]|uniref:RHS repeat-associated core domain-containing protein n=1 Tax=Mesorhizobium sp. TaxID=1871066 RepID=UPI000FE81C28|nr:MAG: RHS repeat-associated core domain-containing protein [Mesorhizobium sp.]